jgi:16S rRNA (guanine527-N7)-methyltransferase
MFHVKQDEVPDAPEQAATVFGDRLPVARRYVEVLLDSGAERGLIGPHEAERVWERHVLNSAVVGEIIPHGTRVVDVGSGAGLPGIPLALARPDLEIVLLEPMARRVAWLIEVVNELGLALQVDRGRAEEPAVRKRWEGTDVVVARAVAPLARLAQWTLPLLRPGGELLAIKGESAYAEVDRDRAAVRVAGGGAPRVVQCGVELLDPPATVVVVTRLRSTRPGRRGGPSRSSRPGRRGRERQT